MSDRGDLTDAIGIAGKTTSRREDSFGDLVGSSKKSAVNRNFVRTNAAFPLKKSDEVTPGDSLLAQAIALGSTEGHQETNSRVKLIAFYLPQFHPIWENDQFWGKGFTEWTNVTRAEPQFQGHYQPQLPGELGFYDLRLQETLCAQAELARQYGVSGFCFYYYWFGGRRVLERPLENMLRPGGPAFPFCVCWANENWTRMWDGANEKVLIEQEYSENFAIEFIQDVIPLMRDPRYIRINGSPVLLVYRVDQLPNPHVAARLWRERCLDAGVGTPQLCAVQSFGIGDPREYGFDAAVEFPPHTKRAPISPGTLPGIRPDFDGYVEDYRTIVDTQIGLKWPDYTFYRGVMPAWDNTPRRGKRSRIVAHSSSELYELWLTEMVRQTVKRVTEESAVFINAWNEWAEGAYIEPDYRFGRARLIATRAALDRGTRTDPPAVDKPQLP